MTLKDVAKEAGVAINTVRKVLADDDSVRPYIRERVESTADRLGYQPNRLARALRQQELPLVPISMVRLDQPFFGALATSLSEQLTHAGYEPALCINPERLHIMHEELATCASIIAYAVDPELARSLGRKQKLIILNGHAESSSNIAHVKINFDEAYRDLTMRLLEEGRRRIAICSRFYLECLERGWPVQKFDVVEKLLTESGIELVGQGAAPAFESAEELAGEIANGTERVDAVFCENDLEAAELYAHLCADEIRPFEDVRIVGCDGNLVLPGMWSAKIDISGLAERIVSSLQDLLKGRAVEEKMCSVEPVYPEEL